MKRGETYREAVASGLIAIVAAAAACGGETSAAARATVRDSAGVQIVENAAPAWSDAERWRLADTPRVDIGVVEGDPHYQFDGVVGAIRLGDGRIVVANRGSSELRFYDRSGRFRAASGRQGGGPGEFRSIRSIGRLPGDSLLVYDSRAARLSVFDDDGQFVRSTSLQRASGRGFSIFVGRFGDGSLALSQSSFMLPGESFPNGRVRYPVTYARAAADGAVLDTIGTFPGSEGFFKSTSKSITVYMLPLARNPSTAVHGDAFYYGSADSYQIEIRAPDGTLRRIVRLARNNRPVTDDVVEQMVQNSIDMERQRSGNVSPAARAAIEKRFAEAGTPETMPAYQSFLVDADDNLWVHEFQPPGETHPPRWTIFDRAGQMLGTITMPARFTPLDIGPDYILGRWRDDLDVEHVQLYGLTKPATPSGDRPTPITTSAAVSPPASRLPPPA